MNTVPLFPSPDVGAYDGKVLEPIGYFRNAFDIGLAVVRKGEIEAGMEHDVESEAREELVKTIHMLVVDEKALVHGVELDPANARALRLTPHVLDVVGVVSRMERDQRMDAVSLDLLAEFQDRVELGSLGCDVRDQARGN